MHLKPLQRTACIVACENHQDMKDVRRFNFGAGCCGGVWGIGVVGAKMVKETGLQIRFFPVCRWCVNWKQKHD